MMKKLFAILFSIVILFSCTVVAFASGDDLEILPNDGYDIGDVDMDRKISIMDATEIQKHLAMLTTITDEQLKLADTDHDGVVSITDVTRIQMYLAGLLEVLIPTQPPVEDDDKPIELPFVPAQ